MKKLIGILLLCSVCSAAHSQTVLSLDSCRAMALRNNKELRIAREKTKSAHYERKAAFTNYLPKLSATGAYLHNNKELSLLSDDQKTTLTNMGTGLATAVPALQALGVDQLLNSLGSTVVNGLRTDTRNVYAGAVTLTQPLFMGGKIRAYNQITRYAEQLSRAQENAGTQDIILSTDEAYWQVVSLANKKRLAESFLALVKQLDSDVDKMIREGVATKADGLSVKVKVNEAEMTLTKVNDGLSLARMLLCQLCGIDDLHTPIQLADETLENLPLPTSGTDADVEMAFSNRPELISLELAHKIYRQKVNVARAEFLPSVALTGNYLITNPSVFNSFEKKFRGMWNVGVLVSVPIFHWGEGVYKVKSAKAQAEAVRYQLDEAKEKIELQVNQCAFKIDEALRKLQMTEKNMEKADENLRYANLGFKEGVIPTSNVLEAQTAWLSAQSEKIDAQIDVKLTDVYLKKALGKLGQ
ncbi:TolC family protein [Bacteroides sp. Marseille-P3684]|uniref:TolC family protein n=1 Tax=Bacteroides sp. Marseille-P3684 TaxID=2086579 RepID=UPI000D0B3660|nr:TolC family protein [Bacteroides sp. Marseille-P3684]